jgi:hypothetical protein
MNSFSLISAFAAQTRILAELNLAALQVFSGDRSLKKQMAHTSTKILESLLKQLQTLEAEIYQQIEESSEEVLGISAEMVHGVRNLVDVDLSHMPEGIPNSFSSLQDLAIHLRNHHTELTAELSLDEEKEKREASKFFTAEISLVETLITKLRAL